MQSLSHFILILILAFGFHFPLLTKQIGARMEKQNYYRVKTGDSWWGIAKKFHTTPTHLAALNGRKETDALYLKEQLRVSGSQISEEEISTLRPKEKPIYPLPTREKVERPFSDITHLPQKGIEYSREKAGWVRASLPGKVINIDYMDGYENYVILEHENGWYSIYANLERVQVTEGQVLPARERIGTLVKNRGLYFQVNQNKNPINPSLFLQQGS
jgi:murein DD-endopeptidase MepM/ murein hydrolase activator NlpD